MGVLKNIKNSIRSYKSLLYSIIFILVGAFLFHYTSSSGGFSDNIHVRNLIKLDFFSYIFVVLFTVVYLIKDTRYHSLLLTIMFCLYGFVTMSIVLDGTPFSINAYWGDQSFRQTMILQFKMSPAWNDFYYKDLPSFYPPLYYWTLAQISNLFHIEHYKMLKIGSLLIYLIGPLAYYYFWKKIVCSSKALLITIFTFLYSSIYFNIILLSPPEFIGGIFFIPFWIFFIEKINNNLSLLKNLILGSVIGGIIFMIYPYPFFIGIFVMGVNFIVLLINFDKVNLIKYLLQISTLFGTFIISAIYWLPPLISVMSIGGKPPEQEWFHAGLTGILFDFMKFSWVSVLLLISIIYLVCRYKTRLHNKLLNLYVLSIVFYFISTLLCILGIPINGIKAVRFVQLFSGVFIALLLSSVFRYVSIYKKSKLVTGTILFIVLLVFTNLFNRIGHHSLIKKAKQTSVTSYGLDSFKKNAFEGSVVLTGFPSLSAFYPMNYFVTQNQHYSHPASQFMDRFEFVELLSNIDDPFVFNTLLRNNRFNTVDYFMPRTDGDDLLISFFISNYPNKSIMHTIKFNPKILTDGNLFKKISVTNMYKILSPPELYLHRSFNSESSLDSINQTDLFRYTSIFKFLSERGVKILEHYYGFSIKSAQSIILNQDESLLDNNTNLVRYDIIKTKNSVNFKFVLKVKEKYTKDMKVYFHIYDTAQTMTNFDFSPTPKTTSWLPHSEIELYHSIPITKSVFKFTFGLFDKDGISGKGFNSKYIHL